MPHVARHLRSSIHSLVSRPSAPATVVPPSFPSSFELRQAKGAESAACRVVADAGCEKRGWGWADWQEEGRDSDTVTVMEVVEGGRAFGEGGGGER